MASKYLYEALPVLISRAPKFRDRYQNCTVDLNPSPPYIHCPIDTSYYYYRVSLSANATFIALFSLSLLGFIATYAATRRGWAFFFAMFSGVVLEIIGYAGRIMSWKNQWQETGFLMQIVCLTIAPAFLAAGIYFCLRRIVYAFGPENSRIAPESYTRIFIPCDLLSLLLQAAGGGLASSASHSGKSVVPGDNIMITGLAFQAFTLIVFMGFCADFAIRTLRRVNSLGESALDQNPIYVNLRNSLRFKGFLCALALSTICIFWRSVYRVAELSEGWQGSLIRKQNLFIAFEGVMVIVAVLALNLFHPALCFTEGMEGQGGIGSKRRERKAAAKAEKSGSTSDAEPTVVGTLGEKSASGSNSDVGRPAL